MKYHVTVGGRTLEVDLDAEVPTVDGEPFHAELGRIPDTRIHSLLLDGRSHRIVAGRSGAGAWSLYLRGRRADAEVVDERTRSIREMTGAGRAAAGPTALKAPMPGLVLAVEVEEGQEVEVGDGLVVVEAMKMENELRAEAPGRVAAIRVNEGDAVEMNDVLIEFDAPEASTEEGA